MAAEVWGYSRAECSRPGCGWVGDLHLSPAAAATDARDHDAGHARADDARVAELARHLDKFF